MMKSRCSKLTHLWMVILVAAMFLLTPTISYAAAHDTTSDPIIQTSSLSDIPSISLEFNQTMEIEHILEQVSEELMGSYIQELQDFGTRYSYSVKECFEASAYISSIFERNGLNTWYDNFELSGFPQRNVIAELPGKTASNQIFIICAHHDSISNLPYELAPGADDNGSGVAAVLAAAELLSDYEFNHTIRFITWSGEEQGLWGARHYVDEALMSGEDIGGVINLDMIATNPGAGSILVEMDIASNGISDDLANFTEATAEKYQHISFLDIEKTLDQDSSDHAAFWNHYPALMLFEDIFSSDYHQTTDTIDKLNLTYCANITQIAIATLAELAGLNSTDVMPPVLYDAYPINGSWGMADPTISIKASDPSPLNTSNIMLFVNGSLVSHVLTPDINGYIISYNHTPGFADGEIVQCNISVSDMNDNMAQHNWSFTVDSIAPVAPTNLKIQLARIELVKQGLVMNKGASGPDRLGVFAPSVMYLDGEYKMWYTGHDIKYQVMYANSSDGLSWQKHGVVVPYGSLGEEDFGGACHATVVFEVDEYKMWYSGNNGTSYRILLANSSDGLNWVKHGPALDLGSENEMDDAGLHSPTVIKDGGEYRMWYSGTHDSLNNIMYANSTDGLNWSKHGRVLGNSEYGEFDDYEVSGPSIIQSADDYQMWFTGSDRMNGRIIYANSTDGLNWITQGLAVDIGDFGDKDRLSSSDCLAIYHDGELKLWYSGFDGVTWRILYANLTDEDNRTDLVMTWTPSISEDVQYYELTRTHSPTSFWEVGGSVVNETVLATTGDVWSFNLGYIDIIDWTLWVDEGAGGWWNLDPYCSVDPITGEVTMTDGWPLWAGLNIHTWLNYSGNHIIRTLSQVVVENGLGDENLYSYYYKLKVYDRAGNVAECPTMVGKIGRGVDTGWNLVSSPFLAQFPGVDHALSSLNWIDALTYNASNAADHWQTTSIHKPPALNDLTSVQNKMALWVSLPGEEVYAAVGEVGNSSIELDAGWNLISYPYHESRAMQDVLFGLPFNRVEMFSAAAQYNIEVMQGTDMMEPGKGYWVYMTSAATWNIENP